MRRLMTAAYFLGCIKGYAEQASKGGQVAWPIRKAFLYGRLWRQFLSRIGPFGGMAVLGKIIGRRTGTFSARCPGGTRSLGLRANTADIDSYNKIFVEGEYDVDVGIEPTTILDAGAHIGCSVAYFASRWPQASIVAVEPEPGNLALLKQNAAGLSGITFVGAALWYESGTVRFDNPHGRTDSYRAQPTADGSEGTTPTVTVEELLSWAPGGHFDLVKLDIEGAERDIFLRDTSWLDRVGCLIVELHDRMAPGCSDALYTALKPFRYELFQHGENVIVHFLHEQGSGVAASGKIHVTP
jgi:FkbM family methyltransferase